MANGSAPNGNSPLVVKRITLGDTSAQAVDLEHMELLNALALRELTVPMPYKANAWEHLLYSTGLIHWFNSIPSGL